METTSIMTMMCEESCIPEEKRRRQELVENSKTEEHKKNAKT
jgi:hypothetical protein